MSDRSASSRWGLLWFGLLTLAATTLFWCAGGFSLDLLFCSTAIAAFMVPPFAVQYGGLPDRLGLAVVGGLAVGCCWMVTHPHGSWHQVLPCIALVIAVLWAETAFAGLLVECLINPTVAAAIVTVSSVIWLAWPLWTTAAPPLVVRVHPLLAINGVVSDDLGIWNEQPIAYPWIALGQDVSYQLPTSIWASVAIHILGGLIATVLGSGIGWARRLWPKARPAELPTH